jgi:hypothetical protein
VPLADIQKAAAKVQKLLSTKRPIAKAFKEADLTNDDGLKAWCKSIAEALNQDRDLIEKILTKAELCDDSNRLAWKRIYLAVHMAARAAK